jgi:hypothetical protein
MPKFIHKKGVKHRFTGVQGYKGTTVQWYKGSGVRRCGGYEDTEVQRGERESAGWVVHYRLPPLRREVEVLQHKILNNGGEGTGSERARGE